MGVRHRSREHVPGARGPRCPVARGGRRRAGTSPGLTSPACGSRAGAGGWGTPCGAWGAVGSALPRPCVHRAHDSRGASAPTALTAAGLFILKMQGLFLLADDQSLASCCSEPNNFFTIPRHLFLHKT